MASAAFAAEEQPPNRCAEPNGSSEAQQQTTIDEDQRYSDGIKSQFRELFDEFIAGLSDQPFETLFDHIKTNDMTLSGNSILPDFKANLTKRIERDFNDFWQDFQLRDGLALLRDVHALTKADAPAGWRPTNKSAREQTRFFRAYIQRKKIAYLEKQVPYHEHVINKLVINVQQKRTEMNDLAIRRQELTTRIHRKLDELDNMSTNS